MAVKKSASVLQGFFGVGFGGGDTLKRFVEDADDPLLFEKRGNHDMALFHRAFRHMDHGGPCALIFLDPISVPEKPSEQEILIDQRGVGLYLPNVVVKDNFATGPDAWTKRRRPGIKQITLIAVLVRVQLHGRVIPVVIGEEITDAKNWIFALSEQLRLAVSSAIDQLANFAELVPSPLSVHRSALILSSTFVLSASSAAISAIMACGLRCAISSPPFGFFTERSNVLRSIVLASTLQDLGESAKLFCSFTNSTRSSSLSGLVLPRLRPRSSW